MRFVFYTNETEKYAGVRHRVLKFAERLAAEGHECVFCPPAPLSQWRLLYENRSRTAKLAYLALVLLRRLAQLRQAPGADAVFLKGALFPYGPPLLERLLHRLNPRMVIDVDDAMWEPPAYVDSPFVRFMDLGWAAKMARMAREVIAGNGVIEAYFREHGARSVTVIPTCIDMERHTQKTYPERKADSPVVLGWTGVRDNLGYLRAILPALRELAARRPVELLVVSDGDFTADGLTVRNRPWTETAEIANLQEPDIGLMPLEDTPRARGKCAFKALQFMGVGTPVVLSPVGMNRDAVEDGVSGFLADTRQEWLDRLEQLAASPALREQMGRAARARAAECYSYDAHHPVFRGVMERAAERKGRG